MEIEKTGDTSQAKLYGTDGVVALKFKVKEGDKQLLLSFSANIGEGPLAICGIRRSTGVHCSSDNPYSKDLGLFQTEEAIAQIQNAVFPEFVKAYTKNWGNYSLMFGGKVNLDKQWYQNSFGIYSGSLGDWLRRNGVGTITCSHLHQNFNHRLQGDFSIHQYFFWSPPTSWIVPVKKKLIGVFIDHEQLEKSDKAVKEFLKLKTDRSEVLKPRYDLMRVEEDKAA